jgi:asparagine synthase (glutamine-hydrolysing)
MCGIAGIVNFEGQPANPATLDAMVTCLAHRGPDGRGVYVDGPIALGHLRLSILDPTPAGAQPMARSGATLIHNGEVYNYVELAEELERHGERFGTGTDTEVILAAYRVWGLDAFARFNGMFAFALWDADRRRLVLVRDRMGVKPLYIRRSGRALAFASEVTALIAARPLHEGDAWAPQPNPGAAFDFLARGRTDHSSATFVAGITALPPGHFLVIEEGAERLVRYWTAPPLADDSRPTVHGRDRQRDAQLVEEFRDLFDSSVRLRLRSDVPIGTCLSGGLDSSSIVMTVAKLIGETQTTAHEQAPRIAFHARFPSEGIDESAYARIVAERSGMRLVYRTPSGSPLLASVIPVLQAQGEPYGSTSIHAQFAVMAAARDHGIKVLLDGQGADELLGGYDHYEGIITGSLLASGHPLAALAEARGQVRRDQFSPVGALAGAVRGSMSTQAIETIRALSRGRFGIQCEPELSAAATRDEPDREPGTWLARRLWQAVSRDGLPSLLRYEDRNSMRFGIEARVPFLDYRLVEFALRLPDRLRIHHGVTKRTLRQAMAGRLPEEVLARRDKLGFAAPQRSWLAAARMDVAEILAGGQIVQRGWVAQGEVHRVLKGAYSGRRGTEQLWRLFVTEAWLRLTWPNAMQVSAEGTWNAALAGEGLQPVTPSDGPGDLVAASTGAAPG